MRCQDDLTELACRVTGGGRDANEAFDELHRRLSGWVWERLRRMGVSRVDVASTELWTEAWLALRLLRKFDPKRGRFDRYLLGFARKIAARGRDLARAVPCNGEEDGWQAPPSDPGDLCGQVEELERLKSALEVAVTPGERELLQLLYACPMTEACAARLLHCPRPTVHCRKVKALKKLRAYLTGKRRSRAGAP